MLGPTYPYLASVGNHDIASWGDGCGDPDGCYATLLKQRMTATGIVPDNPNLNDQMYSTDFQGLGMVFVGETTSQAGDCGTNPNGYACYIRNQLKTDRHIWRICSWHKNQRNMQVGGKSDEMGWAVYENCRDLSAIIATAHEHSYQRTKNLVNMQGQVVDSAQHPPSGGVPGNPNDLAVRPGSTFAFVSGLGGNSMRDQERCLPYVYPYGCNYEWAGIYTLNQTANVPRFGALFIEFHVDGDPYKARGYFKITNGTTIDSFEIRADFDDGDGDGIQDAIDNCVALQNADQTNADGDPYGDACETAPCVSIPNDWTTPAGDDDCDGFTTANEGQIGTDTGLRCAANAPANNEDPPDRWPVDFNDSRSVNTIDVGFYVPVLNDTAPGPPYDVRYDFNGNGVINTIDVGKFVFFLNKSCSP